jgi:methyl-accepting chemotaxis protein
MDQVTQQSATLAEEAAAAAGSMVDQASDLQAAVAVLRIANRADS